MIRTNYHMHTKYCDGKSTAREYILKAIDENMMAIGITAHSPVPFYSHFNMKDEQLKDYIEELNTLKKDYSNKIQVYTGLEVDFTGKEIEDIIKAFKEKLDYKIGSVHFIFDEKTNDYYNIDGDINTFKNTLKIACKGNIKELVTRYYNELMRIVNTYDFDILGHLDIIKKQNNNNLFFSENEPWYKELIDEVLDTIKTKNKIVEINTGGIIRGYIKETYPSNWIIRRCNEKAIPIVLNSDAHHANDLNLYLEKTAKTVKSLGYEQQRVLVDNIWQNINI